MEPRVWWLGGAPSYWQLGVFHEDTQALAAEGVPLSAAGVSRPPREAKNPPLPLPSRFRATRFLAFFLASLSNLCCSCSYRRALRSLHSRAAWSRAFWPFSADRCDSTSHSAHVRKASSGALSVVVFPSSSSRHSRWAATSTRRSSLECCSVFFFHLSFLEFSRAASKLHQTVRLRHSR